MEVELAATLAGLDLELATSADDTLDKEAATEVVLDATALAAVEEETTGEEERARSTTEVDDTAVDAEARFFARGVI